MRVFMKHKAIFLDRDGVLNNAVIKERKPYPPASLEEMIIAPDVLPALQWLKSKGYLLICVTNQPDVARGKTEKSLVEAIHEKLLALLPLNEILVCYHDNDNHCECRKPLPGLILQATQQYHVNLSASIMIGDRWKDIEAGQRAGCETIWINRQYDEPGPRQAANAEVFSLGEAIEWIKNKKERYHEYDI